MQKPKVADKGAKEQIMFQSFHQSQEAYERSKRTETWKSSKLRRALTCNNSILQNRNDMRSLHSYNTLYLWKAQLLKVIGALC